MNSTMRPGADDGGGALYEVGLCNGVWQVTRDGELFGHYRGRGAAITAAKDAAQRLASHAIIAKVVIRDDDH